MLFVVVGGLAVTATLLLQLAFSLMAGFSVTVTLYYLVGVFVAFALNRRLVFTHSQQLIRTQASEFLLTNLAFLPLVLASSIGLDPAQHSQVLAHLIAPGIPAVLTCFIYKLRISRGPSS